MSNPRAKEFYSRFNQRLAQVLHQQNPARTSITAEEYGRAVAEVMSEHDRLIADVDARIRAMPPLPVHSEDVPVDPNELNLTMRMAAVREARRQRREELAGRREARRRSREARANTPKVDTTETFAPKRKLDIE